MLYLGVDQSLTCPGVALANDEGLIFAIELKIAQSYRGGARLSHIISRINDTIGNWLPNIVLTAMEGPSLNSTHREFDLGEISGVVREYLYRHTRREPIIVEPTRLKKFATGNGAATKEEIIYAVNHHWKFPLPKRSDNAADAAALAMFARIVHQPQHATRRCELETTRQIHKSSKKPKLKTTPSKTL
jgi:Holliday junction resolvasome RuvABC endonuclease subunit